MDMEPSPLSTRTWITIALYPIVNAVLIGTAIVVILAAGLPAAITGPLLAAAIGLLFLTAAPLAWMLAPRLRYRTYRRRNRR